MKLMKIIILIPTYNEKNNIEKLVREIKNTGGNFSILVIDDSSLDKTAAEVKRLQAEYNSIHLIERNSKLGLGSAYIEGFKYAQKKDYDVVIQMDGDLSHFPGYLPDMLNLLRDYDLVIGSRYVKGGGIERWGIIRRTLSYWANKLSRILLRVPVYDLTSGFKCIRKEALEKIDFSTIKSQGYAFQIEMVYRGYLKGLKVAEYPIIFRGRKRDKSKMSLGIVIESFLRVISLSVERVFL